MLFALIISCIGLLFLLLNSYLFIRDRKSKDTLYLIIAFYLSVLFVVELL